MKYKTIILAITTCFVAGCNNQSASERQAMKSKPVISLIGAYDNCIVKYVDRGRSYLSFYLAKCGNTSTTSQVYTEGKFTASKTVITEDIHDLEQQLVALKLKEAAIAKLTTAEKEALGIK